MTSHWQHVFTHSLPVRWRDVDPFNVVNHSVFFTYMEEARWHWFYSLQVSEGLTIVTPVVDAQISFRKALTYPDTVTVKVFSEPPAKKTWRIHHEIYSGEDGKNFCAEATIKFVAFDAVAKRVVAIPEEFRIHIHPIKTDTLP